MSFGGRAGLLGVDAMNPIVLVVEGRVTRSAVPGLCAELESLLRSPQAAALGPAEAVECDVGGVVQPDLALVEAVARLGLVARRAGGRRLRLRRVPPEVRTLLRLVGLADVVVLDDPEQRVPGPHRPPVP
ncbi:STAS domain-containing protein [Streptomyces sp. NPDC052179]|uniref:STAS domain-containing protein n=1 Tax=Streptomyces sp. NPDC052179 TaxID=3155680 RepID=UPI003426D09C